MSTNDLLAHAVKALAYRFTKAVHGSAESFGTYSLSTHTRSPSQLVNHLCDLAAKTRLMIKEGHFHGEAPPALDFAGETARFIEALDELTRTIESVAIRTELSKRLLQGPVLDMATHIGQLAMLNGLHGHPVPKENYFSADID